MIPHIDVTLVHENKMASISFQEMPTIKTQGTFMFSKRQLVKWFGIASTIMLVIAAITPDTINIPLNWRPWVYLTAIFWIFAFCTGTFNS
jgi:hypothetical protein